MHELRILPPAGRFIKKIKDKHLRKVFIDTLYAIKADPYIGEAKAGDL